jgi:hypothetical protein
MSDNDTDGPFKASYAVVNDGKPFELHTYGVDLAAFGFREPARSSSKVQLYIEALSKEEQHELNGALPERTKTIIALLNRVVADAVAAAQAEAIEALQGDLDILRDQLKFLRAELDMIRKDRDRAEAARISPEEMNVLALARVMARHRRAWERGDGPLNGYCESLEGLVVAIGALESS